MMKADLADAGIDYVDDAGRYADFHSLRHSTGSLLAAAGVHLKTAQTIPRHSKIDLTMSHYTHPFKDQASKAIAKLPDLSLPSRERQRSRKTDTDDTVSSPEKLGGKRPKSTDFKDNSGRFWSETDGDKRDLEPGKYTLHGPKTAILSEKRRGGDSNPRCGFIPTRRFSKPLP